MPLSAGTRLGRYEIRSLLGAGGMGEVYLARDTELDRQAALKILPAELASDQERMRRFTQEAKAAAALNHPNIAHVYEVGEGGGVRFIAMEYVEGRTLSQLIHRERAELTKLLRHLQHVAEGLAKAHAAGIVHRDLKPDNVMITDDGHAKILDFGLAKLIEPQQSAQTGSEGASEAATAILQQHSTPGMVLGTVGYMSPEQAQGKTNQIDHRSDIFSFGCILFEAVTGRRAFAGADTVDTLNKIIREPAPPISDFRPDVPNHLQRIVRRCLAKDPDERYQTIKDVAIELKELRRELAGSVGIDTTVPPTSTTISAGGSADDTAAASSGAFRTAPASSAQYIAGEIKRHARGFLAVLSILLLAAVGFGYWFYANRSAATDTKQIESIAVLPFVNESGDADHEYLSDGMTETLISSLSQIPGLNVKARSSVFRYKGKEADLQKIAQELNVQAVLSGRITQRGEQLILNLELADAKTENVIWSERYNRRQSDLVSLQTEIAREVSQKLKTKLSGADEQRLAKKYTENTEAYQLYLKGRFHWNRRTLNDFRKAIEYFQQAITLEPDYALAYTGLADTYALLTIYDGAPPREAMPKAKEAALKALSLDDGLAEAHASLAQILHNYDYDFIRAEREYKRAIDLSPNYASAHQWYGELLASLGRKEESFAEIRRALEIDPLSLVVNRVYGIALLYARQYDESIAQLKKTVELDANIPGPHLDLALCYYLKGKYAESVEEYAKFKELRAEPQSAALVRESFAKGGWKGFLRAETDMRRASEWNSYRATGFLVALGEKERAISELNKAYDKRENDLVWLRVEPRLDALRDDPRFQDLIRRVGLPQ